MDQGNPPPERHPWRALSQASSARTGAPRMHGQPRHHRLLPLLGRRIPLPAGSPLDRPGPRRLRGANPNGLCLLTPSGLPAVGPCGGRSLRLRNIPQSFEEGLFTVLVFGLPCQPVMEPLPSRHISEGQFAEGGRIECLTVS